jgi:hypothetical protein
LGSAHLHLVRELEAMERNKHPKRLQSLKLFSNNPSMTRTSTASLMWAQKQRKKQLSRLLSSKKEMKCSRSSTKKRKNAIKMKKIKKQERMERIKKVMSKAMNLKRMLKNKKKRSSMISIMTKIKSERHFMSSKKMSFLIFFRNVR